MAAAPAPVLPAAAFAAAAPAADAALSAADRFLQETIQQAMETPPTSRKAASDTDTDVVVSAPSQEGRPTAASWFLEEEEEERRDEYISRGESAF